jgi:squalene-hopene/tetraprenyl-beta-curcumene cyclase
MATLAAALMFLAGGPIPTSRAEPSSGTSPQIGQLVDRGVAFLRAAQAEDGSFSKHAGPGVTALAAAALMQNGRGPADPVVAKALGFIQQHVQQDGGIYQSGSKYRNYETCLAIMCLQQANQHGRYDPILQRAERFVKQIQWNQDEGADLDSTSFGGAGYGTHKRPDLSNTSFLIDALKSLGRGPDDPAIQQALVFVSRCQNLETHHNQTEFPTLNPDGGFYYSVAAGGSSQAGNTPNGGLRSYGSMTYAGLKSMLYAGVDAQDPRVLAAVEWIEKHYALDQNPGLGNDGYYYYLHTFAKSLSALGRDNFTDSQAIAHNWRAELAAALAERQQPDGSWVNSHTRWLEGDPPLVTSYALLALSYCRHPTPAASGN